nr:phospholipase-like protein [Tanacetum cinerariifolium]
MSSITLDGYVSTRIASEVIREPNADWAMASPYLCDMLFRFQFPLYYADGVKYDVPWLSHNIPLEVDDPISFVLG